MTDKLPILSFLTFFPMVGALLIGGLPSLKTKLIKTMALAVALINFFLSLIPLFLFDRSYGGYQFVEHSQWIIGLNSSYYLGIDGISLILILLSTLLIPIAIMSGWKSINTGIKEYVILFLLLEAMIIGTFCSLDFVLFYLFFEGVLVPMALIIGIWGGPRRIYSTFKFFLYTLLGSVLMLVAILVISQETGSTSIEIAQLHNFNPTLQKFLWLAFFISFAIKTPMWPFHTWLPDAHVEAPTAGSVILAAILLKMGGYGFLRFLIPIFTEASKFFTPLVFTLSVIAVIYTSLVALAQRDMKKLVAYSSVAHMGVVTFGAFSTSMHGLHGSLFQMVSHGLVSGALFLCVGVLYDRHHTRDIGSYGGIVRQMPNFSVLFSIFILASIGLPGTSGFVGEILVLMSAFKVSGFLALGLGTGMVLGAAYALRLYKETIFGLSTDLSIKTFSDISLAERTTLLPLAFLILFLGIYPRPIFAISDQSLQYIVSLFAPTQAEELRFEHKMLLVEDNG